MNTTVSTTVSTAVPTATSTAMSTSHGRAELPERPARLSFSLVSKAAAGVAVLVGAGAFFSAYAGGHAELAWSAYLIGAFYALGLGVFGTIWIAITNVTKGVWSVTMRRIPEAMTAWILPGGVLALLAVALGAHSLYHWSHAEAVAADALLQHKAPFLNAGLLYVLVGASVAVWLVFTRLIVGHSRKQDQTGAYVHTRRIRAFSGLFTVLFAITFSVVSFYLLMSLEAHWFSTMYAVLSFTDLVQTGTAVVVVVVAVLIIKGELKGFVNANHLHSVAKMMFATTGFWAYIYFCQFLLIWYGNLPEETVYFIKRWENGWLPYLLILPAVKFVIPFLYMLPRAGKRRPRRLILASILILVAQFWELFIMVAPAIGHGEHAAHGHVPLVEAAVTLGFVGLFFLVFSWSLQRHPPVPLKDPTIRASIAHTD